MKFELWQEKLEENYTLVEALAENSTSDAQKKYDFLIAQSKLLTTFECDSFEQAIEMRNKYLDWK